MAHDWRDDIEATSGPGGHLRGGAERTTHDGSSGEGVRRRRILQLVGAGVALGSPLASAPVAGAGLAVTISYERCQVAFVDDASAADTLAVYYASHDGTRLARYDIPTTARGPSRDDALRVSYNEARDRTTVQLGAPGSLVRVVAETASGGRTVRTNPAAACVPAEFNAPPTVGIAATTGERTASDGETLRVDADETVRLTSTATDPDLPTDRLHYEWDVDGDGAFETYGETVTVAVSDDRTIAHRVFDDFARTSDTVTLSLAVPDEWRLSRKLAPSSLTEFDYFGANRTVDGETLACTGRDNAGQGMGAVYVYDLTELASGPTKLVPEGLERTDYFGGSLALSGQTLAVSAPYDDENTRIGGAIYVYDCADLASGPTKLAPDDLPHHSYFGSKLGIAGGRLYSFVSAYKGRPGAIYSYDLGDLASTPTKFTPEGFGGKRSYGQSFAVSTEAFVVGSGYDNQRGTNAGAALVYDTTDLASGPSRVVPKSVEPGDMFGRSLAVADGTLAVGAPHDDGGVGAVYVFDVDDVRGQPTKLVPGGLDHQDSFGWSLSISGETLAVGCPFEVNERGRSAGALYVYDLTDLANGPTKLLPEDVGRQDTFGSVSVSGRTLAASATGDDDVDGAAGALYVYER